MKKNIKVILILFMTIILTGCTKDYTAISYSKFISEFNDKKDYEIIDKTLINEGVYKRSYEAGNGNCTFFYFEFENEKDANSYMKTNYKDNDSFSYKDEDNYIIAKTKSLKNYVKIIKVDNTVIIGKSEKFFDRFSINKIYKELGF